LGAFEQTAFSFRLLDKTNIDCFGENTGSIQLDTTGVNGNLSVLWEESTLNTLQLDGLKAGDYTFQAKDREGCMDSIFVQLQEPDSLSLDFTIVNPDGEGGFANGFIVLNQITGAVPPYIIDWQNEVDSLVLPKLSAGTYYLTITDANDCEFDFQFELDIINSLKTDQSLFELEVFPNPFIDNLNISLKKTGTELEISKLFLVDGTGKLVQNFKQQTLVDGLSLDVSKITSGAYFLVVQMENQVFVEKILKH
jgi:hypothetical protein